MAIEQVLGEKRKEFTVGMDGLMEAAGERILLDASKNHRKRKQF
jgi:hypothetical protein